MQKKAAARAAKARIRLDGPAPDYPPELPSLRRTVIVIDHDFGDVEHRLDLYRTNRRDCYRVVADGVEWRGRNGFMSGAYVPLRGEDGKFIRRIEK